MGIWNRKHAQTVYVPALARQEPARKYSYGGSVRPAEGTDFTRLIKAVADDASRQPCWFWMRAITLL